MENQPCVVNIKFESSYIKRREPSVIPITFRNMIWHKGIGSKIELIWSWFKDYLKGERISLNKYLDTPRELKHDWVYITVCDGE